MERNSFRNTKEQTAQLQLMDKPRAPGICGGLFPIFISISPGIQRHSTSSPTSHNRHLVEESVEASDASSQTQTIVSISFKVFRSNILAVIHQRFCNAAGDGSVFPVEDASIAISAVNLVRLREHLRPQGFPQTEVHGRILS